MNSKSLALMSAASVFALLNPAHAQTTESEVETQRTYDTVVVTATRDSTDLQSTPMAVTALTSESMAALGVGDLESIASAVPGVNFGSLIGQTHIAIRGIGSSELNPGVDPRVAFHQDGIYIGRPTAQSGGFFDLERIEVLKGPQGALYGRNATAGAINAISRRPTSEADGYIEAGYGSFNELKIEGAYSNSISDVLAGRIAVQKVDRDGYGRNIATGSEVDDRSEWSARGSLLWTPTENLEFLTIAEYHSQDDNSGALHFLGAANPNIPIVGLLVGGEIPNDPRDVASAWDPFVDVETSALSEIITADFGWANLQSYTSIRQSDASFGSNIDATSFPLSFSTVIENADQFSQEFVLSGDYGKLNWLVGVQYFDEDIYTTQTLPFNLVVVGGPDLISQGYFAGGDLENRSLAPYLRLKYNLTDKISLAVGGRYTEETRSVSDHSQFDLSRPYSPENPLIELPGFPRDAEENFYEFTPTVTVDYQATPNVYLFATYTEGFKAGGFNLGVDGNAFSPETIKDTEAGVRFETGDGRFKLNATAFSYDYGNLQLGVLRGPIIVVENAAQAELYGADVDFVLRPNPAFQIDGAFSAVQSEYSDFVSTNPGFPADGPVDLSGNQLTQAPEFSGRVGLQYTWGLAESDLTLRADYAYSGKTYFTPWNEVAVSQPSYGLANVRLTYEASDWTIEGFVENLGDERYVSQSYVSNILFGAPVLGAYGPPRTVGVSIRKSF